MEHPIRRSEIQDEIERWTEILLGQTGSGTVEVTIAFNVKDRRFLGLSLGGKVSRTLLVP